MHISHKPIYIVYLFGVASGIWILNATEGIKKKLNQKKTETQQKESNEKNNEFISLIFIFIHFRMHCICIMYAVCSMLSQFNTTLSSLPQTKKVYHLAWRSHRKTILFRKYCKPSVPAYSINTAIFVNRREKKMHKYSLYLTFNFINSHCLNQPPAHSKIL